MTREDSLLCSVLDLLEHVKAWKESQLEALPDVFGEAVVACIERFQSGDTPRECRDLNKIVERLKIEWDRFEEYQGPQDKAPRGTFWKCIAELENELTYAPPTINTEGVESIPLLVKQGCTPRQIATIYSHEGKGPFMKNGIAQLTLVQREIEKPGSVLGKDFVHPRTLAEQERLERYDNYIGRRAETLREEREINGRQQDDSQGTTAPHGAEPIEELILQKVPDKQIMKIKGCTLNDINEAKARLEAANNAEMSPADLAALETLITDYHLANPGATNSVIAKALECETKIVASVVRRLKEAKELPRAEAAK